MRRSCAAVLAVLLSAGAASSQDPSQLTVDVNDAVDSGLVNLASLQQADGRWTMGSYSTAITAMCLDAFELHGHLPEDAGDPYNSVVKKGFDYMLTRLEAVPITVGDTDGNGLGVRAIEAGMGETYATAMCLMAFADSEAFASVAAVGPPNIVGRSYVDIAQDIVDYLADGQNDAATGTARGGWRYTANYGTSDNDISRWVAMALHSAENGLGLTIPPFVRPELEFWVAAIQDGTSGVSYYAGPGQIPNLRKTAGLVSEFAFLGDGLATSRMQKALGYIEANWGDAGALNPNTSGNTMAAQAMRRCASATGLGAQLPGGLAWYDNPTLGAAQALVDRQNMDGSWPPFDSPAYDSPPLTTALALAALQVMHMGVNRTTVAFSAIEDDATPPASEDVTVSEISRKLGPHYLNWTASDISSASWLTVNPAGGGDGDPMTLAASIGTLTPGGYAATVEVGDANAANGPLIVDVTFAIQSRPEIDPETTSVTFTALLGGANPTNQTVVIADANTDANAIALAWTATEAAAWLSLPQNSGGEDDVVEMSVDASVLGASGQYTAQVEVTDPGALAPKTRTIDVTLELYDRPVLGASPASLAFTMLVDEATPESKNSTVCDTSGAAYPAPLAWTATEVPPTAWLDITIASGTNGGLVAVEADVTGLAAGDYASVARIADPSAVADLDVDVDLTVQSRPVISPAAGTVYFVTTEGEGDPSPESMQINDANAGVNPHPLSWTASEDVDADWLTITSSSGAATESVQMSAQILAYGPGDYPAQVNVEDPDAVPTQDSFDAVLRVRSKPVINLPDGDITIYGFVGGPDPAPVQATVDDTAAASPNHIAMAWSAVEDAPDETWFDITTDTGAGGESMTLEANVGVLSAGSYGTSVTVSDPNADLNASFNVTFEVQTRPMIDPDSTTITFNGETFGGDPSLQTVTINDANAGANPHLLSWTAAESPDVTWLVLANTSGGDGDAVTLSASLTGLAAGDYNTTVVITDADAAPTTRNISVTFHVVEGTPGGTASFIGVGCAGASLTPGRRVTGGLSLPLALMLALALIRFLRARRLATVSPKHQSPLFRDSCPSGRGSELGR